MPHKEAVIQYLDDQDISAARIGPVNTIVKNKNGNNVLEALEK